MTLSNYIPRKYIFLCVFAFPTKILSEWWHVGFIMKATNLPTKQTTHIFLGFCVSINRVDKKPTNTHYTFTVHKHFSMPTLILSIIESIQYLLSHEQLRRPFLFSTLLTQDIFGTWLDVTWQQLDLPWNVP